MRTITNRRTIRCCSRHRAGVGLTRLPVTRAGRERRDDMAASTEPATTSAVQPMTGAEYLESIRDGREIWAYGERVDDVTTHPAFRNSSRMVARMYDALHDPARRDVLRTPTDTGGGGLTHPLFPTAPARGGDRAG